MNFVYYRDVFGGWRWECRNAQGHLQDSQQSYDTREECVEDARQATQTPDPAAEGEVVTRERTLLCVQPDPQLRESLQQGLTDFQAVLASNSLEAIRLVNSSIFDAYVIDYWLPGSSGVHLCRHIRRTDPHTPICFYTAAGTEEQRRRGFSAGANAYVCASSGPEGLRAELLAVLETSELQSARAKVDEEQAIQEELERRVVVAIDRTEQARALAAQAIESAARARAYARFSVSGGTPAHFERWWPHVFSGVAATLSTSYSESKGRSSQR
jgi:DNA-binding response OmpR family regulator